MEAIYPTTPSPIEEFHHQYEVITPPDNEVGMYSYVQVQGHQHQGVRALKYLYEDASSLAPKPEKKRRNEKSPVLPRKVYERPTMAKNPFVHEDRQETVVSHYSDNIIATTDTDNYVAMHPRLPPSPQRNVTVPQELSALSELSIDDISELSQNNVQLWLLNQMQKLVQKKIEGVHPGETTKEGKQTSSDEAKGYQEDYGLQMFIDQHPYLPLTKSTAAHDTQGPPVPPRTHHRSRAMYDDRHTNLGVQKSPVHQMATGFPPDLYGTRLKPQPGKHNYL